MKKRYSIMLVIAMAVIMVMSMGASVFAEGEETPENGKYLLNDITCSLSMVGNKIVKPAVLTIDGEDAELDLTLAVADRYDEIYMGHYADITEENQDTIGIKGVVDGDNVNFTIPLRTADISSSLYCVVRYKKGYSADHDGDWYKAKSGDYYLTLGSLTKMPVDELAVINTTGMFKAVTASLEHIGEKANLIVALNGNGYENLFKGTYDAAIANGLNKENWINGYKNAAGKWEFVIPLAEGETRIPIVAISKSHLAKVEAGEETLEQCMFYRLFEVDYDAKTLTTGDYYEVNDVAVTNNVSMFTVNDTAKLKTTGTPSSNNYSNLLTLTMGSSSYDKVQADTYSNYGGQMTIGDPVVIDLGEGNVFTEIPVKNGSQVLRFHSAKKDQWYYRKLTMDIENKTAVFDSLSEAEEAVEKLKDAKKDAQAAVDEATAMDTTGYSKENADAIRAAAETLRDLIESDSATVEDIENAKKTLEDAIKKADADKKAADEQAEKDKAAKEEAAKEAAKKAAAKKAAISKVKNAKVSKLKVKAGKKKVTVTWKKNKVFTGYRLKYKVGKKTKTLTIKKAAIVKRVIKKLKKGKVVKVQIRGYKKLYGKMYYGKWSAVKKAKVR